MRPLAIMALALAFALFALIPLGQAHIVGKPRDHSLRALLAFQEKQYAHARYVCVKGSGEPKRWHCAWVPIIRHQLELSRAKQRPAVDSCLHQLLMREGGYNAHKWNGGYVGPWDPYSNHGGSGAYGGPQALPGNKMASAGPDWRDNIWTQIRWMQGYVQKYGGSCGALAFQIAHGYY